MHKRVKRARVHQSSSPNERVAISEVFGNFFNREFLRNYEVHSVCCMETVVGRR